ncbi:hypothetical protein [Eoetvoesiella caeni]|uniref:Uncharacterized protein n=1 Tax=Eoetvoesiella caeni TaxID=645616 RepID=A0A366HLU7_9BURK|nr:hypothetical protein [Eoetvoesiella caeni]MCI2807172.1 hypothetical protein [Eoetvoesiella caeni]NYT53431.1 hypothetical protein [Eoetvoesiella caeni]RBP43416.1 hypothetical protein DFR37_101548 [Eoetvoesiella caeni]
MINLNSDIRLTDELERQLMNEAIEEQNRFKPGVALKNLFVKLGGSAQKSSGAKTVGTKHAESAA